MAHPDANIIFGAVVDDMLGEEVRVTVVAAGFDKVALSLGQPVREPAVSSAGGARSGRARRSRCRRSCDDDDADVFATDLDQPASVSFDAEEDLDIPDFLKN